MGKLEVCIHDSETVTHARTRKATKRLRVSCQYAFDHSLCVGVFCYIHEIGNFALCTLRKHFGKNGPVPHQHGSKGRRAYNTYPFAAVSNVAEFIKNCALVFGLPQPAASRERASMAPTICLLVRITQLCIKSIVKHAVKTCKIHGVQKLS